MSIFHLKRRLQKYPLRASLSNLLIRTDLLISPLIFFLSFIYRFNYIPRDKLSFENVLLSLEDEKAPSSARRWISRRRKRDRSITIVYVQLVIYHSSQKMFGNYPKREKKYYTFRFLDITGKDFQQIRVSKIESSVSSATWNYKFTRNFRVERIEICFRIEETALTVLHARCRTSRQK